MGILQALPQVGTEVCHANSMELWKSLGPLLKSMDPFHRNLQATPMERAFTPWIAEHLCVPVTRELKPPTHGANTTAIFDAQLWWNTSKNMVHPNQPSDFWLKHLAALQTLFQFVPIQLQRNHSWLMTPCKNCWLPSGKPTRQGTSPIVQEEQELQMGDGHSGEMTIQLLLFSRSNSHFLKLNSAFLPLAFRFFFFGWDFPWTKSQIHNDDHSIPHH